MTDDMKKKYEQLLNTDYTQVPRGIDGLPLWSTETTSTSLDRDYWLKLYAGMALQGMSAIPQMVTPENETPTYNELAVECYNRAQALVDEMFKDES